MKYSILTVFAILLIVACSKEEDPFAGRSIEFFSDEGFTRFNSDWSGEDMILETDGSLVIAGNAIDQNPNTVVQPFVVKVDTERNLEWSYFSDFDQDRFYTRIDIIPARNDGYTLVTHSDPEGSNEFNLDLLNFSSNGFLNWKKKINEDGFREQSSSVIQLENGDYMVLSLLTKGFEISSGQFLLLKFSENGTLIWSEIIEDDYISETKELIYLPSDNSIILLTEHNDATNIILTNTLKVHKFDENGNKIWTKPIVEDSPEIFSGSSLLKMTEDGEIYLAYSSLIFQNSFEVVLLKLTGDADIVWEQIYSAKNTDLPEDIINTQDGNLVLLSSTTHIGNRGFDILTTKLSSSDGSILWDKSYGSTSADFGRRIVQRENGNLVIMGNTNHENTNESIFDFFILETDEQGNPI